MGGLPPRGSVFVYSGAPRLKGSIKLEDDDGARLPVRRVLVELVHDGGVETTVTDDMGEYSIEIPDDVFTGRLRVSLEDEKGGTGQLTVGDLDSPGGSFEAAYMETEDINLDTDTKADLVIHNGFFFLNGSLIVPDPMSNVPNVFKLTNLASVYVRTIEFFDWAQEKLPIDLAHLDVGSRDCDSDESDQFTRSNVRISLCDLSIVSLTDTEGPVPEIVDGVEITVDLKQVDLSTLGHEFGHYIEHQSPMGGVKDLIDNPAGSKNHAGYKNPDSSDSLTEGFAHFISAVMSFELHGLPPTVGPSDSLPLINLDQTVIVPGVRLVDLGSPLFCDLEYLNSAEEYAVATLLWDLYDFTDEPGSGDTFNIPIENIWAAMNEPSLNPGNPEIISNFDDLRTVFINAGADFDELFIDRLAYLDSNLNCEYDPLEPVGVTQWNVHDSERDLAIGYELPRHTGKINARQNMLLEVFDPATGEPLTDFVVLMSIEFEPPNDIYNFHGADFVKSSPYIFNAALLQPSTLKITILKDGIEPASVDLTFDEFWTAYTSAPADVGDALITKVVNGPIGIPPELEVASTVLVASRRVGRTSFEYDYVVEVNNAGGPASGVIVTVSSSSPNTQLVDPTVEISAIGASTTVTSTDTYTIRQNRRVPFDPGALSYQIQTAGDP